jgi:hypothetical protein
MQHCKKKLLSYFVNAKARKIFLNFRTQQRCFLQKQQMFKTFGKLSSCNSQNNRRLKLSAN